MSGSSEAARLAGALLLAALSVAGCLGGAGCAATHKDPARRQARAESLDRQALDDLREVFVRTEDEKRRVLDDLTGARRQLRDALTEAQRLREALDRALREEAADPLPDPPADNPANRADVEKLAKQVADLTQEIRQLRHQMGAMRARHELEVTRLRRAIAELEKR